MERVAFLIEQSGERLGCMLNPESVIRRRLAGLRPRRSVGGLLTGKGLADDKLLYTGGGSTELQLELLFDVSISGSTIATEDVRDLTEPLWNLAENALSEEEQIRPPLVRFIWGKSWNIPGIIASVAERLEYFTAAGVPRRSWLRLRMLRVVESTAASPLPPPRILSLPPQSGAAAPGAAKGVRVHEVIGGGEGDDGAKLSERLDEIAWRYYLDPSEWRELARLNGIDNPLLLSPAMRLQVP
jgi:hypothetical protein